MISESPVVSVILPFFQPGDEFVDAIESIVRQSFVDWDLILVNNNASEKATSTADLYTQKYKRIIHIKETRQGISYALNTGLEYARGKFIARMDADDYAFPNRLSAQVACLDQNPDISVVSSQTQFNSEIDKCEGYALFVDWQNTIITPEEHYLSRFIESPVAHPSVMFRKELISLYGPYHTGSVPEDYELWLRWMDKGVGFYKIPDPLLQWNDHDKRLSRIHDNYSREAFYTVKCEYLARWIKRDVNPRKKIVVCGSSKIGRKRADLLLDLGVPVFGFTDVKVRPNKQINFIPYQKLKNPEDWFIVNFISKRGVGNAIKNHFTAIGFKEGKDFILAG